MKAEFVIDASVALAWCFQDEATPATAQLLDRMTSEAAAVPGVWYLEITNVLAIAERKRRIKPAQTVEFTALLERLVIDVDEQTHRIAFADVLPLCRGHGLTSYDAAYLELAMRRRLPLASLDDALRREAKALGVKLLAK